MIALIPLRGGSKGIPNKNIKQLAGKPLCCWVIDAAVDSNVFNEIVVSTDSQEIGDLVSELYGDLVTVDKRPAKLATDEATTEAVMLHIAGKYEFDVLCTIQATFPFTTSYDLKAARAKFYSWGCDSMLTAVRTKAFFWSNYEGNHNVISLNYEPESRPRRQDFEGWMQENGAFYLTSRKILLRNKCRLGGKIGLYEMDIALELDEQEDWILAEAIMGSRGDCIE